MKDMWNERYSSNEYAYGKQPNQFFVEALDRYQPKGRILLPCEGEGRNAVYAAKIGLEASAFDISEEGKKKAQTLAKMESVSINYEVGNFQDVQLEGNSYDIAALIFAHFPADILHLCHRKVADALKSNGLIIIEAFHDDHQHYQNKNPKVGGPKDQSMLFTAETIRRDFADFSTLYLDECETSLQEGLYHNGLSKVIRYIGKKN